jgi:hypothetical protein
VAPRDFLLLRTPTGAMSLREITGTLVVGQQQPLVRVPAPYSPELQQYMERRLQVGASCCCCCCCCA